MHRTTGTSPPAPRPRAPAPDPAVPRRRVRPAGRALAAVAALALAAATLTGCGLFDRTVDVLYIGDSIMNQTGPYAEYYLTSQPGVESAETRVEAINGTGLLTPGLYDWVGEAADLIDTYDPDVVVVLFIGNYTDDDFWVTDDGVTVPGDYGPLFFEEWGVQAEDLTRILQSRGAQVDWVLPPPLTGDEGTRREAAMRDTYLQLQQRVPDIGLIDARDALGGPNGEWVWRRPGVDGGEVTVRAGDSVHLTEDGGRLLALTIAEAVAPQLLEARAAAEQAGA